MTAFIQALIDGLMTGSSYAIIAVAFTVIWASMRTVNLALLQVGIVASLLLTTFAPLGIVLACILSVVAATLVGVASHYVAIETVISRSSIAPLIASIGAGFIIQGVLAHFYGDSLISMASITGFKTVHVGNFLIPVDGIITFGVAALMVALTLSVLRWTKLGLGFRSSAWASTLASSYGVNVRSIRTISVFMASSFAAISGILLAVLAGATSVYSGTDTALLGLIAMLLGGPGNVLGSVAAGFFVGEVSSLSGVYISSSLQNSVSYGLILLLLVLRPSGLAREAGSATLQGGSG